MQGSLIKNIVACFFLVVLCYVLGAAAAESMASSVVIFVALVGLCLIVWLGERCWVLLFILPPIIAFVPSHMRFKISGEFFVATAVMVYWLLMWMLGYVKMRWRSMMVLDLLMLGFLGYMAITYILHPVSLAAFADKDALVGGREYIVAVIYVIFYLVVSLIPVKTESLASLLKWTPLLVVGMAGVRSCLGIVGFQQEAEMSIGETVQEGRFLILLGFGELVMYYIYSRFPIKRFLLSPLLWCATAFGVCSLLVGGTRSKILLTACGLTGMAVVKKEISVVIMLCLGIYAGLLLLSSSGAVQELPFAVQRSMRGIPGVVVRKDVDINAAGSIDWRYELWSYALDPRTGAINDYTWGDGFGVSMKAAARDHVAHMRGVHDYGATKNAAYIRAWHSGWIDVMQTLGIVGLSVVSLVILYALIMSFYVGAAFRGTALFMAFLFYVMPLHSKVVDFFFFSGSVEYLFSWCFIPIAYMKLLYTVARDEGKLQPVFKRKRYVPQMIQQYSDRIHQPI